MKAKIKATGEIITLVNRTRANEQGILGGFYWVDEQGTKYPASDLDFDIEEAEQPEKQTAELEGWICRDFDDWLWLFTDEETPKRESFRWGGDNCMELPKWLFPSVTWQSEPKRVRITIEEIKE